MARRQFKFHNGETGSALAIRVKQSKKEIGFANLLRDGTVVIHLEHKAGSVNEQLVDFIAGELNISPTRIQIVAGGEGDNKLISIVEMDPDQIQEIILALLP